VTPAFVSRRPQKTRNEGYGLQEPIQRHDQTSRRAIRADVLAVPRFIVVVAIFLPVTGCHSSADKVPQESGPHSSASSDLHIAAESQSAIGLKTAKTEPTSVPQTIPATGWLMARPPGEIVVKAPSTGFVTVNSGSPLSVGLLVKKSERLGSIQVFLAPHEQAQLVAEKADANILIEQSQATAQAAEDQLKRIEKSAVEAVPGTRIAELKETISRARAAERHAREKLPSMGSAPSGEGVQLSEVPVEAPIAGRLINVHVAPKQFVVQGDPLVAIADWSRLWVQVPVFAADGARIDRDIPATVTFPGRKRAYDAKSVNAPQPYEPGKQTVAILYEIENPTDEFRPGQAVSVSLPIDKESAALLVPNAAVLWDGMGNSWVYVRTSKTSFRRKKVELGRLFGDKAVVRRGLKEGDDVVTTGAEALYGEEFKDQIHAGDSD
jgi:RND family efflux transporter MFP subunit